MPYPDSVVPPPSVSQARIERKKHLIHAIKWGVSIRSIIIFGETFGAAYFGSSALFMDAIASFFDVLCSLLLVLFIKLAERPPDADHPFGHGRYEPLAGLQLGLLLAAIGLGMLFQQLWSLQSVPKEPVDTRAWIISLGALILLEICYAIAKKAARKHHSSALEADAIHYRIDSLTSLFATVALLLAAYFPDWSNTFDHWGAIAIAFFMVIMGSYAARENLHQVLDRVPASHYFGSVKSATDGVSGVLGTEKIRIQMYGPDAHVDIDVEVDPQLSVEAAHRISQKVRVAIQQAWPAVRDVTVHIEPFYPGDHAT